VQAYKYGGMISFSLGAFLLAVADRFILGASGPEFERAALYAIPLIIWGAFQYPSWVGDNVQLAANRPYLKSLLIFSEQVLRITLVFFLIEKYQINGLIIAYFVGLFAKGFVAYAINHRVCFPQRFYVWQSLIAPFLAGAVLYLLLRWLGGLIWKGDQITSVVIFFIGAVPFSFLFAFFYGFFGGWDDATLKELKQGAELSNFMRHIAWLYWAASALGARISPLHGRFPIDIRQAALAEAKSLMQERVKL
jgi:O-antigen/teichoic acid export membrane protein